MSSLNPIPTPPPWRRIFFQAGSKLMDASRDDGADPVYVAKAVKAMLDLATGAENANKKSVEQKTSA